MMDLMVRAGGSVANLKRQAEERTANFSELLSQISERDAAPFLEELSSISLDSAPLEATIPEMRRMIEANKKETDELVDGENGTTARQEPDGSE